MESKLTNEIEKIKARNARVELDKKWETSWTRRLCICVPTYIVVAIYSFTIQKIFIENDVFSGPMYDGIMGFGPVFVHGDLSKIR